MTNERQRRRFKGLKADAEPEVEGQKAGEAEGMTDGLLVG